jgi:hypothetical protein
VIHVAASFHFVHAWSLSSAFDHVLKRTHEATGIASGAGLYVNFAFVVIWLVDTVLWWRDLAWVKHRIPYWSIQAIFAFLIIQSTVVFGPSYWWPVSAVLGLFLIGLRIANRVLSKDPIAIPLSD